MRIFGVMIAVGLAWSASLGMASTTIESCSSYSKNALGESRLNLRIEKDRQNLTAVLSDEDSPLFLSLYPAQTSDLTSQLSDAVLQNNLKLLNQQQPFNTHAIRSYVQYTFKKPTDWTDWVFIVLRDEQGSVLRSGFFAPTFPGETLLRVCD